MSIYEYAVETFGNKDGKKGNFIHQMEFRKKSNEIIVIDDRSSDQTAQIAIEAGDKVIHFDAAVLIDIIQLCGPNAIKKVDLWIRHHRHRPLKELSIQTAKIVLTLLICSKK